MKKRILYLENGIGFGGAVISLFNFLKFLDKDKYQSLLVHSLNDSRFEMFLPFAKCIRLSKSSHDGSDLVASRLKSNNGVSSLQYYIKDVLLYSFQLLRIINKNRISLVHLNNDMNSNLAGIIAANISRRPCVQQERDIIGWVSPLSRLLSRFINTYIAISGPCGSALAKFGIPENRIQMVPEGLDFQAFNPVSKENLVNLRNLLKVPKTSGVVLMAGLLMPWKGQHILLEAARKVLTRFNECRFILVGETPVQANTDYPARLKRMANEPLLEGKVIFTGFRKDVFQLMQMADVVVHASTSPEPFGRVIIEAMAMERPVISTTIGAPAEIIDHMKTGVLVPPNDPDALSDAIKMLLSDQNMRAEMGTAARKDVISRYNIARHTRLIEGIYESLLQ